MTSRYAKLFRSVILLILPLFSSCAGIQSALDPAGPQANQIGKLWWISFYLLSAVFVVVMLALAWASFRRRASATTNPTLELPNERRVSQVVSSGVAITTVILFIFLIASFLVGRVIYSQPATSAKPLVIEITGHQWWWAVRYNNETPSQILTTANEIHIPVGQPIRFRLNSTDVIHSFWVPNLHGKTDLIPGHPAETWLQADRPGIYRGQCAEFCGHQHAHMAFAVVAEAPDKFASWYQAQLQSAVNPVTASQLRGQQVFLSGPCVMCHRLQGTDAGGNVGPDLTHVASRQTIAAGTLQTTREHLAQWITNAQDIKPGNRMPPIPLAAEDLNSLVDYLQSLQ